LKKLTRVFAVAFCALAVTAPAASASCEPRAFGTVFAAWGDDAQYTLSPGGDFETRAGGWTLGGASVVAGSSGFAAGGSSLLLPAGGSVLSPVICVDKSYPSWRFAARSAGGRLDLEVLYPKKTKDKGGFRPASAWQLSPVQRLSTGQFTGESSVQLRFTAVGGAVSVDDVYVDPRYKR